MNVRYIGHSSFLVSSTKGSRIVTDPFGTHIMYPFPDISADLVVVSHEHQDHNATWRVNGSPNIVKRTTDFQVESEFNIARNGEKLVFNGVPTFHDKNLGKRKGPNTAWVWHIEGIRFCFLGDIGHVLTEPQIRGIGGDVDVLFLPVGGHTTVGPSEAALIVNQLSPKVIFPMHFKTNKIEFNDLASEPLDSFLSKMADVENTYSMSIDLELIKLPQHPKVLVLKYE